MEVIDNEETHMCINCGLAPCDCGGYSEFNNDPYCWGCSICDMFGDSNEETKESAKD